MCVCFLSCKGHRGLFVSPFFVGGVAWYGFHNGTFRLISRVVSRVFWVLTPGGVLFVV